MSQENDERPHWSQSIWSTHIFGLHISIILPVVLNFYTGFPAWITIVWGAVSMVSHYSGYGVVGYARRIKIKNGRFFHGASRIRRDKFIKYKRKRGTL